MSTAPHVSLPRFEGPLDLLLELVRKNEIDIRDIPIADITRQYLDYLRQAEQLDVDLGAEFAYMAAVLIHIKSRALLAPDPKIAEEDPRDELVRMLLDHDQLRQGAEFLKQQLEITEATWSKPSIEDYREPPGAEAPAGALNLLEVLRLAQQALNSARLFEIINPSDPITLEQMMRWVEDRLAPGRTDAGPLFREQPNGQRKAALLLAILELVKAARIRIEQRGCFAPILIERMADRMECGTPVP